MVAVGLNEDFAAAPNLIPTPEPRRQLRRVGSVGTEEVGLSYRIETKYKNPETIVTL